MRWRWEIGGEEDEGENPRALVSGDSMTQDPSYPMRMSSTEEGFKRKKLNEGSTITSSTFLRVNKVEVNINDKFLSFQNSHCTFHNK